MITTAVVPTAGYIISPTKVTIAPTRRLVSLSLSLSLFRSREILSPFYPLPFSSPLSRRMMAGHNAATRLQPLPLVWLQTSEREREGDARLHIMLTETGCVYQFFNLIETQAASLPPSSLFF